MKKIKIVRNTIDINKIILDISHDKETDLKELEKRLKSLFSKYKQFAFCIETGDIIAVIDYDDNLDLNIPGYIIT